jgi:LmbE family N-acetylglucosaminyl deacetylase
MMPRLQYEDVVSKCKYYSNLVIAPHPDDEVLGCGGMLFNNRSHDCSCVLYLGSQNPTLEYNLTIEDEIEKVAKRLNLDYLLYSNKMTLYKLENIIACVTDVINAVKPHSIYIPSKESYNQDHRTTYSACLVALRPHDTNYFVRNVYTYNVDQYSSWIPCGFIPTCFEKINVKEKISAFHLYESQQTETRSPDLIESWAKVRGTNARFDYAEGFEILRMVK